MHLPGRQGETLSSSTHSLPVPRPEPVFSAAPTIYLCWGRSRPFSSGSNAPFLREITRTLPWTSPVHVETESREWDERAWQKSLQFDPAEREHHVLNSWERASTHQKGSTRPCGDFYSCLLSGSLCYSSLTLKPFPFFFSLFNMSHTAKRL